MRLKWRASEIRKWRNRTREEYIGNNRLIVCCKCRQEKEEIRIDTDGYASIHRVKCKCE